MRILKNLAAIINAMIFLAVGAILISLSFNIFSSDNIIDTFNYVRSEPNLQLGLGVAGGILVIVSLIMLQTGLGRKQREKTIAFENPEGQVTVSLSAIEDFIKKAVSNLPEIKELKSSVTASKKGINILCKVTLFSDSNIPETTERIQSIVKSKVQDMLGVEESIDIKVNVTNISSKGKGEATVVSREYDDRPRRLPLGE